jgi:4-carboxymuconolactone decarboxylase
MEHIGTYLNKKGSLSEREVEIGILVIAQHWDANYVRTAHIKAGKAAGLTQGTIDAILAGRDPRLTDPHEKAVHRFAAALVAGVKLSDAEFGEIEKAIGRDGVAEVLVLLGYYTSVSLGMKVHEVPIPQPTA